MRGFSVPDPLSDVLWTLSRSIEKVGSAYGPRYVYVVVIGRNELEWRGDKVVCVCIETKELRDASFCLVGAEE